MREKMWTENVEIIEREKVVEKTRSFFIKRFHRILTFLSLICFSLSSVILHLLFSYFFLHFQSLNFCVFQASFFCLLIIFSFSRRHLRCSNQKPLHNYLYHSIQYAGKPRMYVSMLVCFSLFNYNPTHIFIHISFSFHFSTSLFLDVSLFPYCFIIYLYSLLLHPLLSHLNYYSVFSAFTKTGIIPPVPIINSRCPKANKLARIVPVCLYTLTKESFLSVDSKISTKDSKTRLA
mgnify:CR=1 FL=1